jgi:AraC family ethanolamine operon transcriptional activator
MAARPEQLISSELRRAVRDDVLHVVTAMLPRSEADERAPLLGTRCRIADRARAYVHDRVDQALTIADVCKAIGVCRRSLQYSFNDVYGITPVKYLKIVRLNGARRDLRDAESGLEAVQDVAAKWGFWHLSHFAEDYRRLFLETPSQTLRSRPVALA